MELIQPTFIIPHHSIRISNRIWTIAFASFRCIAPELGSSSEKMLSAAHPGYDKTTDENCAYHFFFFVLFFDSMYVTDEFEYTPMRASRNIIWSTIKASGSRLGIYGRGKAGKDMPPFEKTHLRARALQRFFLRAKREIRTRGSTRFLMYIIK